MAAWAGSMVAHWWDLLTAWLIWGSVVLWALIYELRRNKPSRPVRGDMRASRPNAGLQE
jgi:hypothetical protein